MGLEEDGDYFRYTRAHPDGRRFATLLSAGRPAPITFWYRQAPGLLDPGAEHSWTTIERPASVQTGMYRIRLDLQGRVLFFDAVPREVDGDSPAAGSMDWQPLFAAAALDPSRFQPAAPQWTPATAFDLRDAWTGVWPEAPDIPIRIEAAAWRGKAVSFRIIQPWNDGPDRLRLLATPLGACYAGYPMIVSTARINPMYLRNVVLAALVPAIAAFAQNPITADSPFQVGYAANLNIGESYIDITNTGANGAALLGPGFGTRPATSV